MAKESVPFPSHGYSTVHMHRNQKPVIASSQIRGYSQVGEKRTINGIVKEISTAGSDSDGVEKRKSGLFAGGGVASGSDGMGGAEAAQMSVMMDTLEARLKSITASQQSTEITK